LIADDHPAIRAGVRLALAGHGFSVCAEAEDAQTAVEAVLRTRPDICLVGGIAGNGIAATAEITTRLPGTAVVILADVCDDDGLFDSVSAGASGYLPKDTDPARLPHVLRGVLRGEAVFPRGLVGPLLEELRGRRERRRFVLGDDRGVALTAREWEVLELLRQGLTTAEMATRLFVSHVTVRSHIASAMKKLGAADRRAAVHLLQPRSA
jgi:DNA-binding NarL/FixJ family response regulator